MFWGTESGGPRLIGAESCALDDWQAAFGLAYDYMRGTRRHRAIGPWLNRLASLDQALNKGRLFRRVGDNHFGIAACWRLSPFGHLSPLPIRSVAPAAAIEEHALEPGAARCGYQSMGL